MQETRQKQCIKLRFKLREVAQETMVISGSLHQVVKAVFVQITGLEQGQSGERVIGAAGAGSAKNCYFLFVERKGNDALAWTFGAALLHYFDGTAVSRHLS